MTTPTTSTCSRPGSPARRQRSSVSTDMIKRGLLAAPLLVAVCGVIWGGDGAWSSAYGIALVLANFALAAGADRLVTSGSRSRDDGRRPVRLPAPSRPDLPRRLRWCRTPRGFRSPALGATIIVTHLGLLFWELKYVAISLAYPGLKPARSVATTQERNVLALEFPPINEVIRWQDLFPTFNKIAADRLSWRR